jgi:hypothetical protein
MLLAQAGDVFCKYQFISYGIIGTSSEMVASAQKKFSNTFLSNFLKVLNLLLRYFCC